MVPIIALLVVALAGSIYLFTGNRNGSEARPVTDKKNNSHADRIANAVHAAATRKVREPVTLREKEPPKSDGLIRQTGRTQVSFEGLLSRDLENVRVSPIFPFREEWKVRVQSFFATGDKVGAIKWLRDYSANHPERFPGFTFTSGASPMLTLVDTKNLVESLEADHA